MNKRIRNNDPDMYLDDDPDHCFYCEQELQTNNAKSPNKKTKDHVFPKKSCCKTPLVHACMGCNSSKGSMSLFAFLANISDARKFEKRFRKIPSTVIPIVEKNIQRLIKIVDEKS